MSSTNQKKKHPARCPECGETAYKHGTRNGKQRWRCRNCGLTFEYNPKRKILAIQEVEQFFRQFIDYITSPVPAQYFTESIPGSGRTFRRHNQFFWLVTVPKPKIPPYKPGELKQIYIDGTYVNGGCLLIAYDGHYILNWHWCYRETKADYMALLRGLPRPYMVITDGGMGAYSAIQEYYNRSKEGRKNPVRIQRCLVHVRNNIRRQTTRNPQTPPGQELYAFSRRITRINTIDQAIQFCLDVSEFGHRWRGWLAEKTWIRLKNGRRKWDFTHKRDVQAYNELVTLMQFRDPKNYDGGRLFAYLGIFGDDWKKQGAACTNNPLEGGVNSPVKMLSKAHRGAPPDHQRTLIDWYLYLRTYSPDDPVEIARAQDFGRANFEKAVKENTRQSNSGNHNIAGAPTAYDTGIDTEYQHSVGIRRGWLR